ncbi:DUF3800 domain-containing protein [Piscinibacter terrae]|uniref:DUF3800 domain-containing protein n=1 Tax=Piscinibacter terrae TaxID=2496871 RepID=A0A3N7ISL4_9BURK|nr:DUF3800 domain-containing protein [Albitalea terrae]RQP21842.1 DUF3800 domain-containing protein [Albitalea terrae]
MHLFCDESGNTGVDLLSEDQPVFALACTNLDAQRSADLLGPLLRQGQREAKYSRLKGNRSGQQALLQFFSSPELTPSTAKFLLADKRYYLITHIVDKLIEPPLHEVGEDLYAGDAHVGLVNVWYHAGRIIFPDGHWDKVMHAVVRAMRERTASAFAYFDETLSQAALATPYDYRDFATGLLLARGRLDEFIGVFTDTEVFDPAVDIFIDMINQWMKIESGRLTVTHDRSKPLKRNERFLRAMMTPIDPRTIGYGTRQAELPLRISDLDFAESSAHPQLQVADLIAGAAIDCLLAWSGRRPSNDYHEAMKGTRLQELFAGGLLPSIEIERKNEPGAGQKSLVDGSTEFLKDVGYFG